MGLFILRTKIGFVIFDFLGAIVQKFLDYTDEGSKFVFGDIYTHFFAFKVSYVYVYLLGCLDNGSSLQDMCYRNFKSTKLFFP